MSEPVTSYAVDEAGVALLRLEREKARNAMNTAMLEEILAHLASAREDEAVRVLVLSSNDHLGLSAGADVKEELDEAGSLRRMELFAQVYDELTAFPKPTVAACHGSVVGGGAEVAVACDLRVAGGNLRLKFPGAELGVPVGPARLVTLCGLSTAKYLLLTSRNVSADEALRMGLVHRVAPAARTDVYHVLRCDIPNWCSLHSCLWPVEIPQALWEWFDFLAETNRLDPASDPLWELRKPLLCYGGLDAQGRLRPDDAPRPVECECHLPYRETVQLLNRLGMQCEYRGQSPSDVLRALVGEGPRHPGPSELDAMLRDLREDMRDIESGGISGFPYPPDDPPADDPPWV